MTVAERVKAILARKGLSLYTVSRSTESEHGRASPRFIAHNLYHELERGTFRPSLHQIFALSKSTGFRFYDWLRVFGFHPEDIPRMQVFLPSKRTFLLDSSLDDPESWTPWFRNKAGNPLASPIAPIGHFVELTPPLRVSLIEASNTSGFLYAKIGSQDALAFPDLLPGSIVRANPHLIEQLLPTAGGRASNRIFLIEHTKGITACRLHAIDKKRLIPLSTQLPYAQVEFEFPAEAKVLGVVDLEIRYLRGSEQPDVPEDLARHWEPERLTSRRLNLGQSLRRARRQMGMTFREASEMSRRIASQLADKRYFAAASSLSDYEAGDAPPRHVHKAITLCAMYGLAFSTFLEAVGLDPENPEDQPIPDELVREQPPTGHGSVQSNFARADGFLGQLLSKSGPVPFFLRRSLPFLSGLRVPSVNDFFWLSDDQEPLHPLLIDALAVVVDRHREKGRLPSLKVIVASAPLRFVETRRNLCFVDAAASKTAHL